MEVHYERLEQFVHEQSLRHGVDFPAMILIIISMSKVTTNYQYNHFSFLLRVAILQHPSSPSIFRSERLEGTRTFYVP